MSSLLHSKFHTYHHETILHVLRLPYSYGIIIHERMIKMEKFIAYNKLSKRKQREMDIRRRRTWGDVSPVTRKPANPKAYNRHKPRKWSDDIPGSYFFACLLTAAVNTGILFSTTVVSA